MTAEQTRILAYPSAIHPAILAATDGNAEILNIFRIPVATEIARNPSDVSLPLTVIGGYSDFNGIPTSMSDRSPSFYVHTYTVTPEVALSLSLTPSLFVGLSPDTVETENPSITAD